MIVTPSESPRPTRSLWLIALLMTCASCATLHPRNEGPDVGQSAPGFRLLDHTGQKVDLDSMTSNGPVVVAFYRGYW
jgi:hypothetical protein